MGVRVCLKVRIHLPTSRKNIMKTWTVPIDLYYVDYVILVAGLSTSLAILSSKGLLFFQSPSID